MIWTRQVQDSIQNFYNYLYDNRQFIILVISIILSLYTFVKIYDNIVGHIDNKKRTLDTNDWYDFEGWKNEHKKGSNKKTPSGAVADPDPD